MGRINGRRVVIVAACSDRKRLAPNPALRLRELDSVRSESRPSVWLERLASVDGTSRRAIDLYAGGHWVAVREAIERARTEIEKVELWVASAGYGLVEAEDALKPYSATFASNSPDAVWRGPVDGDRKTYLRAWWSQLTEHRRLADLIGGDPQASLVLVLGATYVDALSEQLREAAESDDSNDRVSLVSVGAAATAWSVPVQAGHQALAGGGAGSLNARLLAQLCESARIHGFRRSQMTKVIAGWPLARPSWSKHARRPLSDAEVRREIDSLRRAKPSISLHAALRVLRDEKEVRCGRERLARLWDAAGVP
jgi:hypothetical protein